MPTGNNIKGLTEKLIRPTTDKAGKADKTGQPAKTAGKATYKTTKKTFYIKENTLRKLQNYASWEWLGITEAFNKVLEDEFGREENKGQVIKHSLHQIA